MAAAASPLLHLSSRRHWLLALAAAALDAQAQPGLPQPLRVTAIPDDSPPELARRFTPLAQYLEAQLGLKLVWTPSPDYTAVVEALLARKVDLAWVGGYSLVQASVRSAGRVIPLVQREEDTQHRSVFIADARHGLKRLADLKGHTFSFGAATSTSGHLMPRSALLAAHIKPETDFKRLAYSGAHDTTLAMVTRGKVEAGALSQAAWDKALAEQRVDPAQIRVIFTTPAYHDYCWAVLADLPAELRHKLQAAFLALDPNQAPDQEILALQRASRFIPARTDQYHALRAAAEQAGLLK